MNELERLKAELERVQKQAAAMRGALEGALTMAKYNPSAREGLSEERATASLNYLEALLSTDAGRDFISREQVKPLVDGLKEFLSWLESEGFKTKPADDALEHARKLGL